MSVFEKHQKEIEVYQLAAGPTKGKLLFAMAILSDVQEMLTPQCGPSEDETDLLDELNEVKELIVSAMDEIQKDLLVLPDLSYRNSPILHYPELCECQTEGYLNCGFTLSIKGILAHIEDNTIIGEVQRCDTCEIFDCDEDARSALDLILKGAQPK